MALLLLWQRIFLLWTLLVIQASTFSSTTRSLRSNSLSARRRTTTNSSRRISVIQFLFHPSRSYFFEHHRRNTITSSLWLSIKNNENHKQKEAGAAADIRAAPSVWNPMGRKVMAGLASLGVLETAYLTYAKLTTNGSESLSNSCGALSDNVAGGSTSSSCGSVLESSYASVGGIPLSLIGMCAYMVVLGLSVYPLWNDNHTTQQRQQQIDNTPPDNYYDDTWNRLALLTVTTTMGITSAFLIYIILEVLQSSCIFCYASATLSATLAAIAWFGGAGEGLMNTNDNNSNSPDRTVILQGFGSVISVLILTAGLYFNNNLNVSTAANNNMPFFQTAFNSAATTVSSSLTLSMSLPSWTTKTFTKEIPSVPEEGYSPPSISTTSSERALQLSDELKVLHTRFFGAYWCSHCYDQKQTMGKEAMNQIEYIECAKDGYQSQNALCKETKIPGYPTWEIAGQLFPGEQSLDELEDIIRDIQKQTSK